MVFEKRIQVECMEFDDYMSYMIYCDGVAVQSEVVMKPHILDTALMFFWFRNSECGAGLSSTGH